MRGLFWISIFILLTSLLRGQDPIYSQFYNAPLQLNPAFAGNFTSPIVSINYRNQWPNWGPRAYATYSASFDQFFENLNSGFGLNINADNAGDGIYETYKISGIYAYRMQFRNDTQIKLGLEASVIQSRLDWDKLIFLDQLTTPNFETGGGTILPSSELRPNNLTNNNFDFSFGVLVFNPKAYAGLTLKHLNLPNNGFIEDQLSRFGGIPIRLSFHGGYTINIKEGNNGNFGTFLAPSIMYVQQSEFIQVNAGALFNKESFLGGAFLRYTISNIDAVILSFGWRTPSFRMTYSYDITISQASLVNSGGAHEIGIIFNFNNAGDKTNYNDCFKIFR